MACQVRSISKTGKLSKVETESLKRQIKKLHVDSVDSETEELDTAEEEVVTQSLLIMYCFRRLQLELVVMLRVLT